MRLQSDLKRLLAGALRQSKPAARPSRKVYIGRGVTLFVMLAGFAVAPSAATAHTYGSGAQSNADAAYVPPSIAAGLMSSTAIPAVLVSGILRGQADGIEAQTTADTYDTSTGRILLIPEGSTLLGAVDPASLHHGNYALVEWDQIRLPSGLYLNVRPDADLLLTSAVDANDEYIGHFVNVPTVAAFATVFFTPDQAAGAQIAVPAGVAFMVMLTKPIRIIPGGIAVPPELTAVQQPAVSPPRQVAATSSPNAAPLPVTADHLPPAKLAPLKTVSVADLDAAYVPPPGMEPTPSGDSYGSAAALPVPTAPPAPPPQPSWYLSANSLVGTDLKGWARQSGWTVVWQAHQDWPVPTATRFQGDFQTVAAQVLNDLAAQGASIRGKFYTGNQTLVVSQPGDDNDQ